MTDAPLVVRPPRDSSPQVFGLFEKALERGPEGAGALEVIYKLHTQERDRSARLAFFEALAKFQAECPVIVRSSTAEILTKSGTKFSYKYADFEEVVETIGPHLRANQLSYAFDSEVDETRLRCDCRLTHVEGHTEVSRVAVPTETQSAMSKQQAIGAALTFAKRQALVAALGLAMGDPDPDGAADTSVISAGQAADLRALIDEKGAALPKVLAFAGVASVEDIRQTDYTRVVRALRSWKKP